MTEQSTTIESAPSSFCYDFGGGFNSQAEIAIQDSDGKILFAGLFTSFSGLPFNRIVRLNSDGTIDETFNIGSGFDNEVYALTIQPDGKILVGGIFSTYNGTTANKIIRLNNDGTIDSTFISGLGFDYSVWTFAIQLDGKILVGGGFHNYNENPTNCIVRLNSDGTLDTSFNIGSGLNNVVYKILELVDGKKLVLGAFTEYNGQIHNRILRLNNDGTVDESLDVKLGFNSDVYSGIIESDGSMVLVGLFSQFNQETYRQIIKLNEDGSVNEDFIVGTGFIRTGELSFALSLLKYSDKYFITGDFDFYRGVPANGLIRLNSDGSIDTTFDYGSGLLFAETSYNTGLISEDGTHIVFGEFSEYNGYGVDNLIYLSPSGLLLNCN